MCLSDRLIYVVYYVPAGICMNVAFWLLPNLSGNGEIWFSGASLVEFVGTQTREVIRSWLCCVAINREVFFFHFLLFCLTWWYPRIFCLAWNTHCSKIKLQTITGHERKDSLFINLQTKNKSTLFIVRSKLEEFLSSAVWTRSSSRNLNLLIVIYTYFCPCLRLRFHLFLPKVFHKISSPF